MTPTPPQNSEQESSFHTYTTHRIPWYVHMIWVGYLVGLVWYLIQYAIPSAKDAL